MIWNRYDVFVSYSRVDAERVGPLVEELRRRGYRIFLDQEEIKVGDEWKKRLKRALSGSRVVVLCWSAAAKASDYVHFEYSAAQGLAKPVPTWRLDDTELPPLHESNWTQSRQAAEVAGQIGKQLGWPLAYRRWLLLASVVLLVVAGFFYHFRAWEMRGDVKDRTTALPIEGVHVTVETLNHSVTRTAETDAQGHYVVLLPGPVPPTVRIQFTKDGYAPEQPIPVRTDKPFSTDMAKEKAQ